MGQDVRIYMVMYTDVYTLPLTHSEHSRADELKGTTSLDPKHVLCIPEPSSSSSTLPPGARHHRNPNSLPASFPCSLPPWPILSLLLPLRVPGEFYRHLLEESIITVAGKDPSRQTAPSYCSEFPAFPGPRVMSTSAFVFRTEGER